MRLRSRPTGRQETASPYEVHAKTLDAPDASRRRGPLGFPRFFTLASMASGETPNFSDELAAIEALTAMLPAPTSQAAVEVGVGDDAAVVRFPTSPALLAADPTIAGVHIDLSLGDLADLGWKAIARNVSDIAAMGGVCLHALCCVVAPPGTDLALLYQGIAEAASQYKVAVVGGDLAVGEQLVVAVSMTGTAPLGPVLRSGARPGDFIFCTGPLGRAAAGLRILRQQRDAGVLGIEEAGLVSAHLRPLPRPAEGLAAARAASTAMIDVSDGFGLDLHRLVSASGVGAELDLIPVAQGATEPEAVGGGEDYELIFSAPSQNRVYEVFDEENLRAPLLVGRVTDQPGCKLGGQLLSPTGWRHQMG